MYWKASLYYKDPADGQINDHIVHIHEMDIYDLFYKVDRSILDHLEQIEIKPIEEYPSVNS